MNLPVTEQINKNSYDIDTWSIIDIINEINNEDKTVAFAVEKELPHIADVIKIITGRLKNGGRLLYFGAGTSGRLGVLDASECPPTFGVDSELVTGIIAGGDLALRYAVEGAEDDKALGSKDAEKAGVCEKDAVIGIAASGNTPYVIGAMEYARKANAAVFSLSNSADSCIAQYADIAITPVVGPEVISGSTRLKAGTAQKMVLNMISTATMIKLGRTYKNLMVDLTATNAKLRRRAINIVMWVTETCEETAVRILEECGWNSKTAIVALLAKSSVEEAKLRLDKSDGFVSRAVDGISGGNDAIHCRD